jgi:hypothetical protein
VGGRRGLVVACVLLVGCAAPEGAVEEGDPAREEPQPTAVEGGDPPTAATWDDAYDAYDWLRERLAAGELDDTGLAEAAVGRVLVDEDERRAARDELARLSRGEDRRRELYGLLMRARPNPDVLYAHLEPRVAEALAEADERPTQRGLVYGWQLSYLLEAALEAYEASGQERFLVLVRDATLEVLSHRDDAVGLEDEHRGRVLRAWGTDHLLDDGGYTNVVTHAGRIAAPMARYAWNVAREPSLGDEHTEAAAHLAEAAGEAVLEFDDELRTSEEDGYGYYWRVTHDMVDALNHQTSVAEAFLYLAEVSEDPVFAERLEQLDGFVRWAMYRKDDGTVGWQYAPAPPDRHGNRPEPVWKGQITIRYLVQSARLDGGFTDDDLADVAESVRRNVLRSEDEINAKIAEEFEPLEDHPHWLAELPQLVPYLVLGRADPELEAQLVDLVADRKDLGGWFAEPTMLAAYASRLR